jgi:hypothetical protein
MITPDQRTSRANAKPECGSDAAASRARRELSDIVGLHSVTKKSTPVLAGRLILLCVPDKHHYQEREVRLRMKRYLIAFTACAALCAVSAPAFADHDDAGIAIVGGIVGGIIGSTLGGPVVYASPPPVVYAPPPPVVYAPPPEVIYTPPPVVVEQRYYAPYPYYAPRAYYRGENHVRWVRHWHHHDDDDD